MVALTLMYCSLDLCLFSGLGLKSFPAHPHSGCNSDILSQIQLSSLVLPIVTLVHLVIRTPWNNLMIMVKPSEGHQRKSTSDCVCLCMCHCALVEVRRQPLGISSHLPSPFETGFLFALSAFAYTRASLPPCVLGTLLSPPPILLSEHCEDVHHCIRLQVSSHTGVTSSLPIETSPQRGIFSFIRQVSRGGAGWLQTVSLLVLISLSFREQECTTMLEY